MTMREDDIDELVERLASPYHLTRPERDRVIATLKRLSTLTDEMVERGAKEVCRMFGSDPDAVVVVAGYEKRAWQLYALNAKNILTEAIRAAKGEP